MKPILGLETTTIGYLTRSNDCSKGFLTLLFGVFGKSDETIRKKSQDGPFQNLKF